MGAFFFNVGNDLIDDEERRAKIAERDKFIEGLLVLAHQLAESITEAFKPGIHLTHPGEHAFTRLKYQKQNRHLKMNHHHRTNTQARQFYGEPGRWKYNLK